MNDRAVVLLSGGLDSATALAMTAEECESVYAVSFDYGQRHAVELDAARDLADHYQIARHFIIPIPAVVFSGYGSSLIDEVPIKDMSYDDLPEGDISPTYMPFRNANLISQATAVALSHDCNLVIAGMHAEDAHNFAYPDCTPEFVGAMAAAVYVGTYHAVRLLAPFQYMTKDQIIGKGFRLGVPFELTHSCYRGERPACGRCSTCQARLAAFDRAVLHDPLPYV